MIVYAPIILFVYNRPVHTRRLLESLMQNHLADKSNLYIFADGFKKNESKESIERVKQTRKIIRLKKWCKHVTIVERRKNVGLAHSVISGVTEIINKFGKTIVLEDDLYLSRNFLRYMNDSLNRFKGCTRVMQISGYMYPVDVCTEDDALFLPFTSSWGWATWKRSWEVFDLQMRGLDILRKDPEIRKKFDVDNSFPFYKMLENQKKSKINSWAIRFYLSMFLHDGLTLYPKKTLVLNKGFDGTGTHRTSGMAQSEIDDLFEVKKYSRVCLDQKTLSLVHTFFRKQNNLFVKLINIIKYHV